MPVRPLWEAIDRTLRAGIAGKSEIVPYTKSVGGLFLPTELDPWIDLELEAPYAIPWRITLMNWSWGKQAAGFTVDPNLPSDNQVDITAASGAADVVASDNALVKVTWGFQTLETALLDYPWGGLTFVVHARWLRLQLENANWPDPGMGGVDENRPRIGAFAVPAMGHAGGGANERMGPRYTTTDVPMGTGKGLATTTTFGIPRRACAYRLLNVDVTTTNGVYPDCDASQSSAGAVNNLSWQVDQREGSTAGNLERLSNPNNASRWYPLHPNAQVIKLQRVAALRQNIALQFMLDLG